MTVDRTVSATFKTAVEPFVGTWTNVDPSTGGIVRATVQPISGNVVTLSLFGACSPDPCEWGPTRATLTGGELHAFYDHGFATRTIRISQSAGRMVIRIHHDYIPPDTRADRDSSDTMRKN
jgi:hypothetical protein